MKQQFETPAVVKKTTRKYPTGKRKLGKANLANPKRIKMFEDFCDEMIEEKKKVEGEMCPGCDQPKDACTCPPAAKEEGAAEEAPKEEGAE
jgi:hypothetical protein